MKYVSLYVLSLVLLLPFLGGCGKAGLGEQKNINSLTDYTGSRTEKGLVVHAHKLSQKESRRYLKRRRNAVIPVQLIFDNTSFQDYQFNPTDINVPLADFKTVVRSLTHSGKAAYSSFVAIVPASAIIGSIVTGVVCAADRYSIPGSGLLPLLAGGAVGLITGVVAATVLTCVYARNKHKKNKQIIAQAEQEYMKPISIPAGKKTSVVLFLKKNTVLPENIKLTLSALGQGSESMSIVLNSPTI